MGLKIVYGRAKTGKSKYIFSEVAKKIQEENRIYIITPEQFSFTAEERLLKELGKTAVINAEVLTFERMAYRIINETGGRTTTNLSSTGKAMLIYSILNEQKEKLKFLNKSKENIEIIDTMITELKKHNINNIDLKNVLKEIENPYLKLKLQDISYIYESFQNKIENNFIEENDTLTILANQIGQSSSFNNSYIYIDEFLGFTPQEYEVIKKLLCIAKEVTITNCIDNLDFYTNPDMDIFYSNKKMIHKLYDIAKKERIDMKESIKLDTIYGIKTKELKKIEQNIGISNYTRYEEKIENIKLFLASNPYSEVENMAKKIISLIRDEKIQYKEISIIAKELDTYSHLIRAIFRKYHIPVFIDEKRDLGQNLFIQYILSVIEIFKTSFSYESMFQYIKSGFIDIEEEEIFKLENYCIKWGIKGSKWYKDSWEYGILKEEDKIQIHRLNELRKIIIEPLLILKESLGRSKTVIELTKALYEFLMKNSITQKLDQKIEKLEAIGEIDLANEYRVSQDVIFDLLDEMVLVFREDKISYEKYYELLKIGLQKSGLGKIPATKDQVIVGDVDRSRSHNVKVLFIIGVNDGSFPSIRNEEGFLDDKDREYLKQEGLELAKGSMDQIYEDNFNIYKAFTTAQNKLYVSYVSSDETGSIKRPSIYITKLKKMFPNLKEESDIIKRSSEITTKEATLEELIINLRDLKDGKKIDPIWFLVYHYFEKDKLFKFKLEDALKGFEYTNLPEKIEQENIDRLYGDTMQTTISRLEQYRSCPFSFYLKYGLKLSVNSNFRIEAVDTGSFMHEVIDEFFEMIQEKQINIKELKEQEIQIMVERIVNEKLALNRNYIFTSTKKFVILTNRLKHVVKRSILYIIEGLKQSKFEVWENEAEFKEKGKYEPLKLELENGKKVEITGKIDRIDLFQNEEGRYVRIIDYKSSIKNIDLNEVVAGIQIQLLTYLDAVSKIEDLIPAGVLYFHLIDPMIKNNKNLSDEEIKMEIKKKFKMQGLILADINVVKMMDKNIEKGSSEIVPIYIDKTGNISHKKSSVVTKKQFEYLQKHMTKTLKEIANEIQKGDISLHPYYNTKTNKTPCEYCEYKSICNFSKGFCKNEYHYIGKKKKEDILEEITMQMKE